MVDRNSGGSRTAFPSALIAGQRWVWSAEQRIGGCVAAERRAGVRLGTGECVELRVARWSAEAERSPSNIAGWVGWETPTGGRPRERNGQDAMGPRAASTLLLCGYGHWCWVLGAGCGLGRGSLWAAGARTWLAGWLAYPCAQDQPPPQHTISPPERTRPPHAHSPPQAHSPRASIKKFVGVENFRYRCVGDGLGGEESGGGAGEVEEGG